MSVNTFIFMGRPGAGKGMQSGLLSQTLKLPIFSTGDRVREVAKEPTMLGKKIAEISNSGKLTPFWFAAYLFEEALFKLGDNEGIIFEGVGRKVEEAKLFAEIMEWLGRDYRVINLETSEETVTGRLLKRSEVSGREDDRGDKLGTRFKHYDTHTSPALDFFDSLGKVIHINGEPLPEVVHAEVVSAINRLND